MIALSGAYSTVNKTLVLSLGVCVCKGFSVSVCVGNVLCDSVFRVSSTDACGVEQQCQVPTEGVHRSRVHLAVPEDQPSAVAVVEKATDN